MSRPISTSQIRAIKTAQRSAGLEDADYRTLLRRRFGVDSCTQLDVRQANALLLHLWGGRKRAPAPKAKRPPRLPAGVERLATPAQTRLIGELAGEIDWREPEGYRRWLAANQNLERVATSKQAARVIEGLRALKRRA